MIFVTVGTQKFQMDRLIKAIDEIVQNGYVNDRFFVQSGCSKYVPQHCDYAPFLDKEAMERKINECTLLICHAGVGSILMGIKKGIKVIVVPRMKIYGEHVDDHQIEIAESFAKAGYIKMVKNTADLPAEIEQSLEWNPLPFTSNKERFNTLLMDVLAEFEKGDSFVP